ncbi:hypothetical protein HK099_007123 [Clydaea vesicula]|uniref:Uncharacterized protein n=1 Tax=Clydaea vesicula TaxID=447962 RepID=A0AAD5TZD1_9FUNG|nr:hypothetical protein HK099_007123 [Clydaea vesicula]
MSQRHKNTFAWTVNEHSFVAQQIAAKPVHGLCKKCLEIIDWRKRMGKYKPLTVPKKCVQCLQKGIKEAYHVICPPCARAKSCCAKCLELKEIVIPEQETLIEENKKKIEVEKSLVSLNERQRRSYLRKISRGDEEGARKIAEKAAANDMDSDFSDFSDEEDDEETD